MKGAAEHRTDASELDSLDLQTIDICVRIAQFIGLPKSIGELYGLLFISPDPLPLDALSEKLHLSKGSASQGLKQLRAYNAIKPTYVAGDRRDHYVAETDLKRLLEGFVRERMQPGVADLAGRLAEIRSQAEDASAAGAGKRQLERLDLLQDWQRQIQGILPLVDMLLSKGKSGAAS